jgi:hypothetical protein
VFHGNSVKWVTLLFEVSHRARSMESAQSAGSGLPAPGRTGCRFGRSCFSCTAMESVPGEPSEFTKPTGSRPLELPGEPLHPGERHPRYRLCYGGSDCPACWHSQRLAKSGQGRDRPRTVGSNLRGTLRSAAQKAEAGGDETAGCSEGDNRAGHDPHAHQWLSCAGGN